MEFDKSKVYTAANADELKIGSKVIVSNYFSSLRNQVEANSYPAYIKELTHIMGTSSTNRFKVDDNQTYNLAYLVSEPGEKKLKWTDLKLLDKIQRKDGSTERLVTGIYWNGYDIHIEAGSTAISDTDLVYWEKVEE